MKRLEYYLMVQSDDVVWAEFYDEQGRVEHESGRLNRAHLSFVQHYQPLLQSEPQDSRALFTDLGTHLYRLLFDSTLDGHFKQLVWRKIEQARSEYCLAIELTFQDGVKSEIAGLPWEFLYCPYGAGSFLATDQRLAFSRRRLVQAAPLEPLGSQEALRVLLIHLQPKGEDVVSLSPIRRTVQGLAKAHPKRLIEPVILKNPLPTEVAETVQAIRPHIVHWLLHGHFSQDGTHFAVVDQSGKAKRWYGDRSLADLFQAQRPSLVILQACEGGRQSDIASFSNGAAWLVRQQIPAVVAMHYPISNETGWIFAEAFYQQLVVENQALDVAVQRGRLALARMNDQATNDHATRDFGAVAFWMQRGSHSVLSQPEEEASHGDVIVDGKSDDEEEEPVWLSLTFVAPDGTPFEADLFPNTMINYVLQNFTTHWLANNSPTPPQRYTLHLHPHDAPLNVTDTLEEAGIKNNATLYLVGEALTPNSPVSLTIEDQHQERYMTAVMLKTPLSRLVRAFLEFSEERLDEEEVMVELVNEASMIPLDLQQSLYEAGVSDDALLRIYPKMGGRS